VASRHEQRPQQRAFAEHQRSFDRTEDWSTISTIGDSEFNDSIEARVTTQRRSRARDQLKGHEFVGFT